MTMQCPYSSKLPATKSETFFGRKQEIQELLDGFMQQPQPRSFGIIGGPQMGKTSLLYRVLDLLEQKQHKSLIRVYIDTNEIAPLSPESTLRLIESKLWSEIQTNLGQISENEVLDAAGFRSTITSLLRLETLVRLAIGRFPQFRAILIIDRTDRLAQMPDWEDLSRQLAYIVGMPENPLGIVLAGTEQAFRYVQSKVSPLGLLIDYIKLFSLSQEEALELIQKPIDKKIPEVVANFILEETGGHPFLIQFIMENLFRRLKGQVQSTTLELVDSIVEDFYQNRDEGRRWFSRLNSLEQRIYEHFVHSTRIHEGDLFQMGLLTTSEGDNHTQRRATTFEIRDALSSLSTGGLIRLVPDSSEMVYELSGNLCARYFQRYVETQDVDLRL